jgi:hypothetical protein
MTLTKTYDVLFMADHFVMVTTIETVERHDRRDIEADALKRLADEYGQEFADNIKSYTKQVSVEEVAATTAPQEPTDTMGGGDE